MKKGTFLLYDVDLQSIHFLTNEQVGILFKALADYRLKGESPDFGNDSALNIIFYQIKEHIAINEEKYKEICRRNSESAKKRWNNQSNTNDAQACEGIHTDAKQCLYDTDTDNNTDNNTDIVTDIDTGTDACGAKRKADKNHFGQRKNFFLMPDDEPSYDIAAFERKSLEKISNHGKKKEHIN